MLDKKKFYINGQWVDSKSKEEINVVSQKEMVHATWLFVTA